MGTKEIISENASLEDLKMLQELIEMVDYRFTPRRKEFQLDLLVEVSQKINDIEFEQNSIV